MFVCHCRAVTDRVVRGAIEAGASEVREVARRCGAGSRCGGCWPALEELLAQYGRAGTDSSARAGHEHAASHAA